MVTMLTTMWLISNSMWLSDTIWWQRSESTLARVLAWCLTAPSHYLSQCWLIINDILRHSPEAGPLMVTVLTTIWLISNSVRLSDIIWWQRSGSTLAQVLACCLTAPSHYLSQCWLINDISGYSPGYSQFHRKCSRYLSLIWFWKLQI